MRFEKTAGAMARQTNIRKASQGLVCDAIVRLLEERTGFARAHIDHPERRGGPGGVDLLFNLGPDQYALEHTLIEAFPNQLRHDAHFLQFYGPVKDQLQDQLPKPGVYDLIFPLDTRVNVNSQGLEPLRKALVHWVQQTARELHAEHPRRLSREESPHGIRQTKTGRPEGFPFEVTLVRSVHWSESGQHDGVLLPTRTAPEDVEPRRGERIQTALEKKRSKLSRRKSEGASAILVLEDNDIALSNHALVGDHIATLLPDRPCWIDELYLVDTTTSRWTVWQWNWEEAWWQDGWTGFDPDCLDNVCAA